MADEVLDAKNLNCPLPILKAKKAINGLASGGTLQVLATLLHRSNFGHYDNPYTMTLCQLTWCSIDVMSNQWESDESVTR